jgi:protease-4
MKIIHFIKQVFTIAIGFLVSLLFLLFITVFALSQLTPRHTNYEPTKNSVLELNMEGRIVELVPASLFGSNKGTMDLKVVKKVICQATDDRHINGIYLNLSYLQAGWPVLEEIREALLAFKKKGKTIVAYSDYYTQKSYYLASIADEIVLNPSGILEFRGLSATVDFYTNLFENIAIKPIVFRIGDYKSAVEPFCLNKMSEESKRQTRTYLNHTYAHFLTNIGLSRNITVSKLKEFAHNLSATLPEDALEATLITRIGYAQQAKDLLKEHLHKVDGTTSPPFIPYQYYATPKEATSISITHKIAVMVAEGEIIDGLTAFGYIGSKDFVKTMQAIQADTTIKAVVLRINSPGGSVLASDVMWKAIEELKKTKPVVASMSDMAASGGYYIAAPCHYIFAQPTTLTGSIGIFGILFDTTKLMQKIGIERDVVKTAPSADFLHPRTTCSETESKFMYRMLQKSYDAFLYKIAEGRGLKLEQVENLASGRIFSGIAAQQNGLVDALGGLEAAIEKAVALAALAGKYNVCYLPLPKSKLEELLKYTSISLKMEAFSMLAKEYPILNHFQIIHRHKGLQAILPYIIDVE